MVSNLSHDSIATYYRHIDTITSNIENVQENNKRLLIERVIAEETEEEYISETDSGTLH